MSPKKKKEETKPKPLDLKLTLENFGPLRKAEIDLKPMTIFIGPNNSGKTYTATMLYCLFRSIEAAGLRPDSPTLFSNWESDAKAIHSAAEDLGKLYDNAVPEQLSEKAAAKLARVFSKPLANRLKEEIDRCWPPDRGQLRRAGTEAYRLDLGSAPLSFGFEESSRALQMRLPKGPVKVPQSTEKYFGALARRAANAHMERYFDLANIGSRILFSQFDRSTFYLPPSRSGFIRDYRVMTDRALERFEWRGGGQPAVHLPGVDLDLMRHIVGLPQSAGRFASLAAEMARSLIKGDVVLMWADKNLPPDILYRFGESDEIGLERASSGVADLVPLLLFTSRLIKEGDLLIIDEPEVNQHPEEIRVLAKWLIRLVRAGVNLIIATHSDYLFGQLNNYVLYGKLRQRKLAVGSDHLPEVYLDPGEVGAYLFKRDKRIKTGVAYRTESLHERMTEDGLPEDMFVDANSGLYGELVGLRRQLYGDQ